MELSLSSTTFDSSETSRTAFGKCSLSALGVIEVKGEDASKFLQNLVTSDVRLLHSGQGQFSSWCDGKGRVQATFWLIPLQDILYLVLPESMVSGLLSRLRMLVLRSRVSLRNASEDLTLLGVMGVPTVNCDSAMNDFPEQTAEVKLIHGCAVMAIPGVGQNRFLVLGAPSRIELLTGSLLASLPDRPISAWFLGNIRAGIPNILEVTSGEFIPQMLSLESLGALSFTKGCYPGQEVVARLQYRGQLKRKLFQAIVEASKPPAPGTRLFSPHTDESVGQVLAAEPLDTRRMLLQAVVVMDRMLTTSIHLETGTGPVLQFDPAAMPSETFRVDVHVH